MATKKAAVKKTPAKKVSATTSSKEVRAERDDKLQERIVKMKNDGKTWAEIADTLRVMPGRAIFLYDRATVKKVERITGETDKELGQAIVRAREQDLLSWGKIAVRANIGEAKARALYAANSKNPDKGQRIGKGGRYPGGVNPNAATNGTTKKAAPAKASKKAPPAKKATAKKATAGAASGQLHPLENKSLAFVAEKLEGKTVKLGRVTGKKGSFPCAKVVSVSNGKIVLESPEGIRRTVDLLDTAGTGTLKAAANA